MNDDLSELIRREHAKRERNWNPVERWRVIQETITWAEQLPTVGRNTRVACLAHQARLLASFAGPGTLSETANEPTAGDDHSEF